MKTKDERNIVITSGIVILFCICFSIFTCIKDAKMMDDAKRQILSVVFYRTEIRLEDRTDIASIFQYNGKDIYVYEDDLQEKCEAYDVGSRIPVYLQVVTYGDGSKSYSIENILS